MLITGILHENGDKVDYSMDHLLNDNTTQSATYFLIKLFGVFNLILDNIEFIDSVNIGQCWNEIFSKVVRFANLLELRRVIKLKQKSESRINYVSVRWWDDLYNVGVFITGKANFLCLFDSCRIFKHRWRFSNGNSSQSNKVSTIMMR